MKITEKVIDNPEKKGEAILGYTAQKECIPVRMEDILYFETVDGRVFAYTTDAYYEIKNKLYQIDEKLTRKCMQRQESRNVKCGCL